MIIYDITGKSLVIEAIYVAIIQSLPISSLSSENFMQFNNKA